MTARLTREELESLRLHAETPFASDPAPGTLAWKIKMLPRLLAEIEAADELLRASLAQFDFACRRDDSETRLAKDIRAHLAEIGRAHV